jgi:hypothetical protein
MSIFKSKRPRKRAVVALATLAASAGGLTIGGARRTDRQRRPLRHRRARLPDPAGQDFFAFDRNTGAQVGFVPARPAQYFTRTARSNCVVNEEGPFTFTLPPGNYRIQANYFPGNNFRLVNDVVANLDVQPAPPPPPYEPPPPCYFDGCF